MCNMRNLSLNLRGMWDVTKNIDNFGIQRASLNWIFVVRTAYVFNYALYYCVKRDERDLRVCCSLLTE